MSEELSVERSPAVRKSPSRLKKVRYRLTKQGKIAATILLVLAVLIPTSLAVGLGSSLVAASGIGRGDVLLLFHTIGVNASCIQAAGEAKRLGATVIGIASDRWQDETPADAPIRSPGKENLRDLADIYVNDCNTVDDAVVGLEGMEAKAGPLSGIGTFAIAHMLELAAMEECLKRGVCPPVWENANTPEGERRNGALMDRYSGRVPML